MEEAKRAAERFAQEPVSEAGFDRGTEYSGGRYDVTYYFETESGRHVTVRYYVVGDEYRADWGTW
jgi:hypothetical protein